MDSNGRDAKVQPIDNDVKPEKEALKDELYKEDENESESLLLPGNGGIAKGPPKMGRKVQWNDDNGYKLAEILEYQPSEVSDSDDDDSETCFCTIM